MITVTKELAFDAAHRLIGHEGKCRHLHGHRYTVNITCTQMTGAGGLDEVGRVIDFSCIKDLVGKWIDEKFDHGTICNADDDHLVDWLRGHQQKLYCLNSNPTAENIAMEIYRAASDLLRTSQVRVVSVRVDETPTCSATYASVV